MSYVGSQLNNISFQESDKYITVSETDLKKTKLKNHANAHVQQVMPL